jgi:hypothetical protein
MKQILIKISLFLLLLFLGYAFIFISLMVMMKQKANFKFESPKKIVILGHSHTECAFNEKYLLQTKNLAQSGEAYLFSKIKLAQVIKHNPEIEEVWIEFSNNQLIPQMDQWMYGDIFLEHRFPVYAPFMSIKDHLFILRHNVKGYIMGTSLAIKKIFLRWINQEFEMIQALEANTRIWEEYIEKPHRYALQQKVNCNPKPHILEVSLDHITYLMETIQMAKMNGKRVTILRSPLHHNSSLYCIEKEYQFILSRIMNACHLMDLSGIQTTDKDWLDPQHLNEKGAEKLSKMMNRHLSTADIPEMSQEELEENPPK